MIKTTLNTSFAKDVDQGLSNYPKKISSKYFYDKKGDEIFQKIMAMPSYYVTDAEFELLEKQSKDIASALLIKGRLNIFELGAGDGTKTILFLRALTELNIDFHYFPIDISPDILKIGKAHIRAIYEKELYYKYGIR
jgi:L-histidine N-alpha-methyltransferase